MRLAQCKRFPKNLWTWVFLALSSWELQTSVTNGKERIETYFGKCPYKDPSMTLLSDHGLINYIDIKTKCHHLKILTSEGTLRQVFIIIYRLDIVSHVGIFNPALWIVAPLSFSLVQLFPPLPLPCVNRYTVYMYTVCKGRGGYGVLGLRQIKTCRKVPLEVNFVKWRHFSLLSMSLIFLHFRPFP